MKITKEEYERLELIYNTFCSQLRIKDNFLLKKNRYNSSETRLIFDYLFGKPYIENSAEPIDYLIIDEEYKGIVMYYLVLCQIVLVDNNLIQGIDNMKDDFYHPFIVLETKNILAMK